MTLARHRPLPPRRTASSPGTPQSPDVSVAALVPAKVLGDTAKSLTSGAEVTIALSAGGAGEGLIGFEGTGRAASTHHDPPARRRVPQGPRRSSRPSTSTVAKVNKAELIETVKRVALVAERNTAVQLKFADDQIVLDAGSGDEAQADRGGRRRHRRRRR